MKVQARCKADAWDSPTATYYYAGEVYTIDHDGQLASMRTGRAGFVFEFDRTMAGTGQKPAVGGYVCKQCGLACDSLNDIGTHSRSAHKEEFKTEDVDDSEPVVVERRGTKKGKTFTCKECSEVLPNLYAFRVHKKVHQEAAETAAVPA